MLDHLQMTIEPSRHHELLEIVRRITERASKEMSHGDIQYLDVTEEGNPRRSFDINIYKSGLRLEDLYPHLLRALAHYAIDPGRFESLYQRILHFRRESHRL